MDILDRDKENIGKLSIRVSQRSTTRDKKTYLNIQERFIERYGLNELSIHTKT